jgi:hypothetical protein
MNDDSWEPCVRNSYRQLFNEVLQGEKSQTCLVQIWSNMIRDDALCLTF